MFQFVFLVLFLIFCAVVIDVKKPKHFPPGPAWLPVVGSLWAVVRLRSLLGYHHLVWTALASRWGPVVGLRLGRDLLVLASSGEAVREVMTRDDFEGRPLGFFFRMRTFGERLGIVFIDGPLWQTQRKFSLHYLKQFGFGRREMEEQISEEVKQLIGSLHKRCSDPVHLHNLFDVSVINVLWAMMAGERFSHDDSRLRELLDIIHEQFRACDISGGLLNQMPWLRWVAPGRSGYTQHVATLQRLMAFLRATVAEHRHELCVDSAPRDLIDAFLQQQARGDDETFSEHQLLSLCMDLFMAGSETTANTLEFVVLYLVRHREVQTKMQAELDAVVGRDRWTGLRDRANLPYTQAVLNEVQRCAHVAPSGIVHRAIKNTELLGHRIPQDALLLTNLYALHTDPDVFSDPNDFRPERFLQLDAATLDKNFAPFGYGKRRCLGEALARANLFLVTTALFQHFTISTDGAEPSLQPLDGITLSPHPCELRFTPRY